MRLNETLGIENIYLVLRPDKKKRKRGKVFSSYNEALRHKNKVDGRILFRYNSESDTWILERIDNE